jgi:hypothetical protein
MTAHRVFYGKGEQPIRTVLHLRSRPLRVTAATYAILDTRYGADSADHILVAAGTAAAVDAASTTLSARAGRAAADPRRLTVASSAAFAAHRQYLIESSEGRIEIVRVVAITSATEMLAAAEIVGDFSTGAQVRGVELTAQFPAVAADDDENLDDMSWVIVWTAAGIPPIREPIRLHRGEEAQLATLDDLFELPGLAGYANASRQEPGLALARAHRDLRTDLTLAGASETDLLTGQLGREAVLHRAAHLLLSISTDEGAERRADEHGKRYQELRAGLTVGRKKPDTTALDKRTAAETSINPARHFAPL